MFLAGGAAENAAKVCCPRGHPYAGENLYVNPSGKRECRACHRRRAAEHRARNSSAASRSESTQIRPLTRENGLAAGVISPGAVEGVLTPDQAEMATEEADDHQGGSGA